MRPAASCCTVLCRTEPSCAVLCRAVPRPTGRAGPYRAVPAEERRSGAEDAVAVAAALPVRRGERGAGRGAAGTPEAETGRRASGESCSSCCRERRAGPRPPGSGERRAGRLRGHRRGRDPPRVPVHRQGRASPRCPRRGERGGRLRQPPLAGGAPSSSGWMSHPLRADPAETGGAGEGSRAGGVG